MSLRLFTSLSFGFGLTVVLASCTLLKPNPLDKDSKLEKPSSSALARAQSRAEIPWWQQLNDPALNDDIQVALSSNPSLAVVASRIEQANAALASARAQSLPSLNLGFGYRKGRKKELDLGPYNLAPWAGNAGFSWELDLSGKLRAAQQAAAAKQSAAHWDYHSARLFLASKLAQTRISLYRYNVEISKLEQSLSANQDTLKSLGERTQAGLIAPVALESQRAEQERLKRSKLELERLRELSLIQLRTLRGGSEPKQKNQAHFPRPDTLSPRPLNQLLASHPQLMAAEARVRSAFQVERAAKLNLLPSFQINLLASGARQSLANEFVTWAAQAGPSLDIPIYDPIRIAALQSRQAQAKTAAAEYQKTVLDILEEIESARMNLQSSQAQLAAAQKESQTLARSRESAREKFTTGLSSELEYLDTQRRWLEAKRSEAALQQAMLNAQIQLIKATGGGRI